MKSHNFILGPCDTDSISFCKPDQSPFTEEEQESLINEINALMPEYIQYAHDGYFKRVVVLKSKNYILYDGKKIKFKGSSLKSATLEPKFKQFLSDIIDILIHKDADISLIKSVYHQYVIDACNIKDIKPWCSKKSITATTISSERTNETKLMDAITDTEYSEGDKVYTFFKSDATLCLAENFDGDYDKLKLLDKLYKCVLRFDSILPIKGDFINYGLKAKSKIHLENLLNP